MLNKKAIAAFAAGATLLSGMAFAAPAFAETAPKQETCKVDATKLNAAKVKAAQKLAAELTAKAALDEANAKVDTANTQLAKVKGLKKTLDDATTEFNKTTAADTKDDYSPKQKAELEKAKNEANEAYTKGLREAEKALGKNANDFVDVNGVHAELRTLQGKAADAKESYDNAVTERKDADAEVAKLSCTPAKPQGPQNPPVTPAQPGSKEAAIKNVLAKKVDVDAASHDFAEKKESYTKAAAALTAAKAELDAANKAAAVAAQNLSDFEASGVNDSAKLKSLKEAVDRADAHVVRTTAAFNKALADFNDAKTADLAAQAAYNAAKDAYDEAYNAAIKLGVNPALLPSVTAVDPLSPAFPQLAQAQKIYADALAGKFGAAAQKAVQKAEAAKTPAAAADKKADKQGKITVEKGKDKAGKNLPKTGAAIALTALAASVLAGMGAAVRKVRH